MRVLLLVGVTGLAWLGLALAAAAIDGDRHWLPSAAAAVLCLVPAVGTTVLATVTEYRSPVEAIGAVLMAPLIRLVVVLMGGFVLWRAVPAFRDDPARFGAWVLGFYLITLAAETAVLLSRPGSVRPAPTGPDGGT